MNAEGYGADQTGKREWRARVWCEGRWHTLGCRENQNDALKAARRVWHSLHGDWSGGTDDTRSHVERPTKPTEGLPKVTSGGLENKGLHADKKATRYPDMGETRVRVKAADSKGAVCEHCGSEMYRPRRGRFCSDGCRKATSRMIA